MQVDVPEAGILRIVNRASGKPTGVGFAVDAGADQLILTCAHVINAALDLPARSVAKPGDPVTVDAVLAGGASVNAEVVGWEPVGEDGTGDVARLRPLSHLPDGVRPLPLATPDRLWDRKIRCFGFPVGQDDGIWATGQLLGRQGAGLVVVEDNRSVGYPIQRGFSGSPAWDDDLRGVVGMVVGAGPAERRTSYLVPNERLLPDGPAAQLAALRPSPYRGLRSFGEEDAALFFGRDELAKSITAKVRRRRVVALTGPSGVGKSSLVFAGVLPRLRATGDLAIATLRPGEHASRALAAALLDLLEPELSEAKRLVDLPDIEKVINDGRTTEVIDRILQRTHRAELLVVVDQLEEALDQNATRTAALTALLAVALDEPSCRVRMLLAIRSDFVDRALGNAELARGLQSLEAVGQMTRDQLAAAVTRPLPDDIRFETNLDRRIVDDLQLAPGQLPLLQFTLDQLWRKQVNGVLGHRAYADLGGVGGTLAGYAEDDVWARLTQVEQGHARSLFMSLVRIEPDLPPTRRSVRRHDISPDEWRLAKRLIAQGLLVGGRGETVELAHEALIGHWGRLRAWVEHDREFRVWLQALHDDQQRWAVRPGNGTLLKGRSAVEVRRWLATRKHDMTSDERSFATRIVKAKRRYRYRWLPILIGAAAILASVIVPLFGDRAQPAGSAAAEAADKLAAMAQADPSISENTLLRSIAAYRTDPTVDATDNVYRRYKEVSRLETLFTDPHGAVDAVAADDDGQVIVTRAAQEATLWRLLDGRMVPTSLGAARDEVAVNSAGDLIVIGEGRRVHLFDGTGQPRGVLPVPVHQDAGPNSPMTVAIAGDTIATWIQQDDQISVFKRDGRTVRQLPVGAHASLQMWFGPESRTLVTLTGESREIRIWDIPTGRSQRASTGVQSAAVRGNQLVYCQPANSRTSTFHVYHLSGQQPAKTTRSLESNRCDTMELEPSGKYLFARDGQSGVMIDLARWSIVASYAVEAGRVGPFTVISAGGAAHLPFAYGRSVEILPVRPDSLANTVNTRTGVLSPDGTHVATVHGDIANPDEIILWNDGRRQSAISLASVQSIDFSQTGQYLSVTFGGRADVEIRRIPTLELVRTISPPRPDVHTPVARFDGDDRLVVGGGGRVTTWAVETGHQLGGFTVPTPAEYLGVVRFDLRPGGVELVTPSVDQHGVDVWNRNSGKLVRHLPVSGTPVVAVFATPRADRLLVGQLADGGRLSLKVWDIEQGAGTELLEGWAYQTDSFDELHRAYATDDTHIVAEVYEMRRFTYDGRPVDDGRSVAISYDVFQVTPDRILSGSTTIPPQITPLDPEAWVAHLCRVVGNREMTGAERGTLPPGVRGTNLCTD